MDAVSGDAKAGEDPQRGKGARMTINVGPATQAALHLVVEREGVSITEAVRRLVSYGEFLYRTTRVDGDDVLIRRGDTIERIVAL